MKCPRCQSKLRRNENYCHICGKKIVKSKAEKEIYNKNLLLIIIGILVLIIFLETYFLFWNYNKSQNEKPVKCEKEIETEEKVEDVIKNYGFGEKFVFDNFEIVINDNYTIETMENEYSDYNEKMIVRLPIVIRNLDSKSRNLDIYDYEILDSHYAIMNNASAYYDDSIDHSSPLEPYEIYVKYFYFIFAGNDIYTVQFGNNKEKVLVNIKIEQQ